VCADGRYKFEINSTDGNGFAKHIKQDHNLWIYLCVPRVCAFATSLLSAVRTCTALNTRILSTALACILDLHVTDTCHLPWLGNSYFMIYLWKKPVDDQTGFESYVFFRLNELLPDGQPQHKRAPDVSWFPNNEAMAIPDLRDANTDFLLSMRLDVLSDAAQVLPPLTTPSKLSCPRRLSRSWCVFVSGEVFGEETSLPPRVARLAVSQSQKKINGAERGRRS
jgi:hypothetical protein